MSTMSYPWPWAYISNDYRPESRAELELLQRRRLVIRGLEIEKARAFSPDQFPCLFPRVRSTSKTNILKDIRSLQLSPWGNILRRKHHIIRKLICQESSTFKRICGWKGGTAFHDLSNRIYSNDYRRCRYSFGCKDEPIGRTLYDLPEDDLALDGLFCEFNTDKVSDVTEDFRSHLLTVSVNNYLYLSDLDSGRVMRKIFLSNKFKFSTIRWNTYGESFVLKATNNVAEVSIVNFIVFEVFPLRLHSHVALTQQVFNLSDANLYGGLLIVKHSADDYRIYSYDRLVEEFTNKTVSLDRLSPDGIPLTVDVHDLPPVLMCYKKLKGFGGVPLHYLETHEKEFQVCRLQTNKVIENGLIPQVGPDDKLSFLSYDSNMLVHATYHCAKILKIEMTDQGISRLCKLFTILPHKVEEIRHPLDSLRLKNVKYNDDLSLIVATSVIEARGKTSALVCFHDDQTGHKLKTVELEENWHDKEHPNITLDMDTLTVTYHDSNGYYCNVYRLDRSIPEDSLETKPQKVIDQILKLSEIHI